MKDITVRNEKGVIPLFECVKIMFSSYKNIVNTGNEIIGHLAICRFEIESDYKHALVFNMHTKDFEVNQHWKLERYSISVFPACNTFNMYKYLIKEGYLEL